MASTASFLLFAAPPAHDSSPSSSSAADHPGSNCSSSSSSLINTSSTTLPPLQPLLLLPPQQFYYHPQQQQQQQEDELLQLLYLQQQEEQDKMVRKRLASELDLQSDSSYTSARLSRRPATGASSSSSPANPAFLGDLSAQPSLLFNPPSSLSIDVGQQNAAASVLLPVAASTPPALLPSLPSPPPPPALPSLPVCGFSGLPLFPPENDRIGLPVSGAEGLQLVSSSAVGCGGSDDGGAGTAWVDGIIRDIISSSAGGEVSIPQIVHSVRDIVHPCNPGLAALLEFRLRSLTSDPSPAPALPSLPETAALDPSDKRRRDARVAPPLPEIASSVYSLPPR